MLSSIIRHYAAWECQSDILSYLPQYYGWYIKSVIPLVTHRNNLFRCNDVYILLDSKQFWVKSDISVYLTLCISHTNRGKTVSHMKLRFCIELSLVCSQVKLKNKLYRFSPYIQVRSSMRYFIKTKNFEIWNLEFIMGSSSCDN